jgi:autotransporter translocation and assembly factor TamB
MAYATLAVPADRLPYVENIVPGMPLAALAVVDGSDAKLTARGYLGGANGTDRLDAPFDLAATGTGTVGPVVLQRRDGASVYARATLDRGANTVAALVDIHRLSLLPAPAVSLPGLVVPTLPKNVDAHLDATLTGAATGTTLSAASGALHAYGSWGDLRASADGSAARLAARGRLTSSFERLEPFTGKIGARGGIDIPFAVTNSGPGTVVQIADARFPGARVRGIALQGANATLGIGPRAIDIYSADLRVADRDVTAVGSLGNGGHVQLTAGDLDLQPARAAGLPLSGGHATVIADIGGTVAKPTATVLAALGGARYADTDVGGDVGLAYDGAALQIQRATLVYGAAYAAATGVVSGLTPGRIAPRYDVRAQLEDADIATLAHTVKNPLRYPEGTLDANLRVGGGGAAPAVSGDIRIPEGSLNGLSFRDAHVGLDAGVTAVNARDGQVTVGSTRVAFAGSAAREHQHATLRSTRVDLSDFDDYFDEAEVLAGTGHAALTVDATPQHVKASADLLLNGTRYRRFDLGNVRASVATVGSTVRVDAGLAGTNGRLGAAGSIVLAADPLRDPLRRSYLDLHTQIAGLNLGNILPAAGLEVPLLGIVDGSATVRGRYPALSLTTHAALTNGVAGRVPIDRFTLAASAAGGRGRLTDLTLIVPGATASATGTFGLRPDDAFDVRADTSSADINELIASATGQNPGVKGTLETHSRLTGTLARPQLATSVDAANVAYSGVTIPAVHVDLAGTRQALDVRNGRVTLTRGGAIGFDGHVPLGGTIALATTPISFDFTPQRVDVGAYSALLPDGSVAQGIFDGNVSVRGTVLAPRLGGQLAFTKGSFHSKTLTSPLTAIELDLAFSGTRVQIAKLHAHVAPGNIDGSGFLALRDLQDPIRGLTANVTINVAGAHLAAPKYYVGAIDGTITARKQVAGPATIGGNLTFSSARIPYTALTGGGSSGGGAAPALPDVAFGLGVNLGRDVRVQSGPVDIGATGMATLGGTLAKPTLDGSFSSTDGTVSLYRTFTVQNGSAVSFSPADGVTPSVDATATTSVADPPTDVLLRITGLSTNLHLAFSSEPSYSQQQILGLLVGAQALGAVSGVASSNGSSTGGVSIAGIGAGVLNTQLTQQFLQPFSSKLGGALGLSDLNVGYNTTGGVSAAAVRRLGKNISFTYGEQIGGPAPRTSLGVKIGSSISSAQLTFYQTAGADAFGSLTPFSLSNSLSTSPPNYTLQSIEPPTGSGFVFSYQRHFW